MSVETPKSDSLDVPGLEVPIDRIDRSLGELWEQSGEGKTRASLINLAIYSEEVQAVHANTELIATIAGEHACRAILILAEPKVEECSARAWIGAHCHLAGKGEICSEQITFHLAGEAVDSLPGTVFSHLDSDLPLYFWWQASFPPKPNHALWSWVDRLIFDSAGWDAPAVQFERVLHIVEQRKKTGTSARPLRLADLNWARLLHARYAFASLFDTEAAIFTLPQMEKVVIRHAANARTAGLLFLGWLATRLGWELDSETSPSYFVDTHGKHIAFELEEGEEGRILQRCRFEGGCVKFFMNLNQKSSLYELTSECSGMFSRTQLLHAGDEGITEVLTEELGRGGAHPLFYKSLRCVWPLLRDS